MLHIKSLSPKLRSCTKILKPLNPKPHFASLHLSTAKPPFYSHFKIKQSPNNNNNNNNNNNKHLQIVKILNSENNDAWKNNDQLKQSLNSISSKGFLQIVRCLGNYQTALHFVDYLQSTEQFPDEKSLCDAVRCVFDLARRGGGWERKVFEVYAKAMEWRVSFGVNSGEIVDDFMRVYGEMETHLRNVHVRNVLIDGLLRIRRLDDALQVLDEMLQPGFEVLPDEKTMEIVFPALLRGKEAGRWVSEEEFVEMVARFGRRGFFPNSITLTNWISSFCRCRQTHAAWELLHIVMELGGPVEAQSCNALLTGLNKAREFKKMNILMKEMQEKGVRPSVVTLGISINHLCKSTKVDEALGLFEKMRRGEIGADIKPDVIMYNTLIDGLCKLGRVDEGLSMMRRMRSESECSPSTITFNCLIDGFCKEGEVDKALELFDEMNKEGVESNIITVNILVSGFCRDGRAGGALKFYRQMEVKGFKGNAKIYTSLISGFCGVNNIRKAMELLGEMKGKCPPDAIVYLTLISGLSQAGLMDEVDSILTEMKSAGFSPDNRCYNVMINGFCKKNKLDKAHRLLKEMETDGLKPDVITYNTLISYFSKTGDLKTLRSILRQMIKDKIEPTVVTYGVLINAFCSVGELNEAMKIFKETMQSSRIPPNTVIYNTLIDCHCRNNMFEGALSLFDEMLGKGVEPNTNTFNALFKVLREKNCLEKALELMDKMTEKGCCPDYITLEVLSDWLSATGEAEKFRCFVEGRAVYSSS